MQLGLSTALCVFIYMLSSGLAKVREFDSQSVEKSDCA